MSKIYVAIFIVLFWVGFGIGMMALNSNMLPNYKTGLDSSLNQKQTCFIIW